MFTKLLAGGLLALMVSGFSTAALAQNRQPHVRRVPHRIQRFDANHDGVLQANEVPARLQTWFAACDTNRDGVVTAGEIRAYNRAHPHPRHHHGVSPQPQPQDI
ncbi:MAG TPA: hypothetical protein VGH28_19225 [Polyangiaceae bacterium]|jgi:hypothetical protein